jgi:hypothetical protein
MLQSIGMAVSSYRNENAAWIFHLVVRFVHLREGVVTTAGYLKTADKHEEPKAFALSPAAHPFAPETLHQELSPRSSKIGTESSNSTRAVPCELAIVVAR